LIYTGEGLSRLRIAVKSLRLEDGLHNLVNRES
jgi:hypothetical protein